MFAIVIWQLDVSHSLALIDVFRYWLNKKLQYQGVQHQILVIC